MPQAGPGSESAWYAFMGFDPAQHRRVRGFYVPLFAGAKRVLDLACGRGEFLSALREAGGSGVGVDSDAGMVEAAREAGLKVELDDAFSYLDTHRGELDGVFSAHFIEHLDSDRAEELIRLACQALRPGGRLLIATPNSANLPTLQREFWWDATHVRFYDADLLRFWFTQAGLIDVEAGTNPESYAGAPVGLNPDDLQPPPVPRYAHYFERFTGMLGLRHHQVNIANTLAGLIKELYRPSEIYVTGRKRPA